MSLASFFFPRSTSTHVRVTELSNGLKYTLHIIQRLKRSLELKRIQQLQWYRQDWERGVGIFLPAAAEGNQLFLQPKQA